jgi:hypothetical protein
LYDQTQHFIKQKIFIGSTEFPDRISAKDRKVYYISSKEKKLQEKAKIYATSAAGSVVVEGVEESAAAVLGGGVEELGIGVEEATEGVIRDTILAHTPSPSRRTSASPKEGEHGKSQPFPNLPLRLAT